MEQITVAMKGMSATKHPFLGGFMCFLIQSSSFT
jgi:hypothetical protein